MSAGRKRYHGVSDADLKARLSTAKAREIVFLLDELDRRERERSRLLRTFRTGAAA
jgi:hypothetical protein